MLNYRLLGNNNSNNSNHIKFQRKVQFKQEETQFTDNQVIKVNIPMIQQ